MNRPARRIAVLGAPGTGAVELLEALRSALAAHTELEMTDQLPPQSLPQCEKDLALLMGLGLSSVGTAPASQSTRQRLDSELRQQLQAQGLSYRVVYGNSPAERLNNALHALGLPVTPGHSAVATREWAQFDLNRGRTPWSCEKCSDPDCEHRLFTGLLRGEEPHRP